MLKIIFCQSLSEHVYFWPFLGAPCPNMPRSLLLIVTTYYNFYSSCHAWWLVEWFSSVWTLDNACIKMLVCCYTAGLNPLWFCFSPSPILVFSMVILVIHTKLSVFPPPPPPTVWNRGVIVPKYGGTVTYWIKDIKKIKKYKIEE